MGIFTRESGVDVLDLPDLHRRGLLKLPAPEPHQDDIVDLSKPVQPSVLTTSPISPPSTSSPPSPAHNAVADFLSDFASIGAAIPSVATETTASQVPSGESEALGAVKDLKWRLENTEYKMEQLLERLAKLEDKLNN